MQLLTTSLAHLHMCFPKCGYNTGVCIYPFLASSSLSEHAELRRQRMNLMSLMLLWITGSRGHNVLLIYISEELFALLGINIDELCDRNWAKLNYWGHDRAYYCRNYCSLGAVCSAQDKQIIT